MQTKPKKIYMGMNIYHLLNFNNIKLEIGNKGNRKKKSPFEIL